MAYAILSDIHANHEALLYVLDDIKSFSVDRIICLGDTIGYGPDPCETLDLARRTFDFSLKGNHEHAVLFDTSERFNEPATISTEWTRKVIRLSDEQSDDGSALWSFLTSLQEWRKEENRLYVHATPAGPLNEYLFPDDTGDREKLNRIFRRVNYVSFGGHTHVPGVFEQQKHRFLDPESNDRKYTLNETKVHVNVGSVGQSRDGNRDACYVIVDGREIHFRRVPYDVERTADKIFEHDHLPNSLGRRLLEGQ